MLDSWDKMILPKPFGKIVVAIGCFAARLNYLEM